MGWVVRAYWDSFWCVWWDGGYLVYVWSLLGSCGGLVARLVCVGGKGATPSDPPTPLYAAEGRGAEAYSVCMFCGGCKA